MLLDGSASLKQLFVSGAVGLLTAGITYSLWQAIYNAYFHPLCKFPGPKLWAASRVPREAAVITGQLHYKIKALHDIYGPVVRTGRDELAFSSGAALRDIHTRYGPWHTAFPKDPIAYPTMAGRKPSILTVLGDDDHSRYRRLLSHAFSDKALQEQAPLIKKYIDLLMKRLHENSEKGPQDLVKWFNFVTFDIIGDLSLGESFDCLQKEEYHDWVTFLFKAFKMVAFISSAKKFPWLNAFLLSLAPKSLTKAREDHMAYTKERVLRRIDQGEKRPDFMTNVLKHNDKESGMSREEIVPTFGILLLAGSETTATLLSAVTFLLLKHQEVLEKLINEIRTTFKHEDDITQISVNKLTYQTAVLEEALRFHPPTPFGFPRIVPGEKGQFVGGYWVPAGTIAWTATYSTNRQEANFRDADKFDPERFLGNPKYKSDNKAAFQPFSLGPRNCIGMNLAYAEMRLILARLLWNFDLELEEKSRRWIDGMKMYTLWEKPPLHVKLKRVERGPTIRT
ncbi:cytochrome P450 [Amylocarpus encephaloides]|uniref:Cytochrome P450 n=1 Tax=Amylocarpus encephaloides TaxID=45428 RepID=A0A9P7YP45_9HELO|nr:cytochrome P450 [Amylocarpus encephaloides]